MFVYKGQRTLQQAVKIPGGEHEGVGNIIFPSNALLTNLKYNPESIRKDGLVVQILKQ